MTHSSIAPHTAVQVARAAAGTAAQELLRWFDRGVTGVRKADGSVVTQADTAAESAALRVLQRSTPAVPVLTEESGLVHTEGSCSDARWLLDPLDGTARFARGSKSWGPLVAYESQGRITAGALSLPAFQEHLWAGQGLGAFCNGAAVRVAEPTPWPNAVFAVGSLPRALAAPCGRGIERLLRTCSYAVAGGDLAAAAHTITGEIDAWLEIGVAPWDTAPMRVLIEEAGGAWTDLSDTPIAGAGTAILIGSPSSHDHALRVLRESVSA